MGIFVGIINCMNIDTVIILIIVGIALFIWVPAIVISVRKVLKKEQNNK